MIAGFRLGLGAICLLLFSMKISGNKDYKCTTRSDKSLQAQGIGHRIGSGQT
jgi:hypothetical protein